MVVTALLVLVLLVCVWVAVATVVLNVVTRPLLVARKVWKNSRTLTMAAHRATRVARQFRPRLEGFASTSSARALSSAAPRPPLRASFPHYERMQTRCVVARCAQIERRARAAAAVPRPLTAALAVLLRMRAAGTTTICSVT